MFCEKKDSKKIKNLRKLRFQPRIERKLPEEPVLTVPKFAQTVPYTMKPVLKHGVFAQMILILTDLLNQFAQPFKHPHRWLIVIIDKIDKKLIKLKRKFHNCKKVNIDLQVKM